MKKQEKVNETKVNLLRERQAAQILGISAETLRKSLRYKGLIPFVRFGQTIRYRRTDLDAFIAAHRVKTAN
jgi:excisionase family DNA binding protein